MKQAPRSDNGKHPELAKDCLLARQHESLLLRKLTPVLDESAAIYDPAQTLANIHGNDTTHCAGWKPGYFHKAVA